ncbi:MAG: hypothetical protein KKB81_02995 [Candidatus Margulisbacteria bacterium]|nr:hypothetical protein [Candidatus Margulisiibacteriota bacterium]MBU1022211.1 hypothetical protein [Candidatus Margulisiibacteriota bacterium]MBU1729350.1 hypothetical protein [Candidatus Margulisiibacteriota bacterium]MBU1955623.1 hypothetical protein [Candidatus Margulisiibacteriota bacterium]
MYFLLLSLLLFWIPPQFLLNHLRGFFDWIRLLAFYLSFSLGYALVFVFALNLRRKLPLFLGIFILPAALVAYEYLLTIIPLSLPMYFGVTQQNNSIGIQSVNVFGPWVVTFLIFLTNYVLYKIVMLSQSGRLRVAFYLFAFLLAVLVSNQVYGLIAVQLNRDFPENGTAKVCLVQPNIEFKAGLRSSKVDYFYNQSMRRLIYLSRPDPNCDLIIWPELSVLRSIVQTTNGIFEEFANNLQIPLLFGSPYYDYQHQGMKNTVLVLSEMGLIRDKYSKTKLFPKFEEIDYIEGKTLRPLLISKKIRKVGALLCFESLFPQISRSLSKKEISFLVVLSNDAWFGDSNWPRFHLACAIFRAIENGSYAIHLNNNGPSAVISPTGKIMTFLPEYEMAYANVEVGLKQKPTIYKKFGDWFAWLCLAYVGLTSLSQSALSLKSYKGRR